MRVPILIQHLNKDTRMWHDVATVHAPVNKASNGSHYLSSASQQSDSNKVFKIRYAKQLSDIEYAMQHYRIIYKNTVFKIEDYDDFQEKHINIELLGVSTGVKYKNWWISR